MRRRLKWVLTVLTVVLALGCGPASVYQRVFPVAMQFGRGAVMMTWHYEPLSQPAPGPHFVVGTPVFDTPMIRAGTGFRRTVKHVNRLTKYTTTITTSSFVVLNLWPWFAVSALVTLYLWYLDQPARGGRCPHCTDNLTGNETGSARNAG